jgi:uncharacterized protein (TIRG00374 family)
MLLVVAAATLFSTAMKGVRWWIFLRRSTTLRVGQVIRFTFAGLGLNAILLANAGEVIRVGLAARAAKVRIATVLGSLASDKVVEILAFLAMAVIAVLIQPTDLFPASKVIVPALVAFGFFVAFVAYRGKNPEQVFEPVATGGLGGFLRRGKSFVLHFANEARTRLRGLDAVKAFGISLVYWPTQIIAFAAGAEAVGLHIPIVATVAAVVAVNLAGFIRATPGNVGVFQVFYALAVTRFGFPQEKAVAAAVLIQSVQLVTVIVSGVIAAPSAFTAASVFGSAQNVSDPSEDGVEAR